MAIFVIGGAVEMKVEVWVSVFTASVENDSCVSLLTSSS